MATTRRPGRDQRARPGCGPGIGERLALVLRGLAAVLLLLVTAADALVTAVLGVRPVLPVVRRWGRELVEEYRSGRAGAVDVQVIDTDREVWR